MGPQPQDLLPPQAIQASMARNSSPNGLFQQNPIAAGLTPDAMASQPGLQTPPPPGSDGQNPMMTPPQGTQPGSAQLPGQPAPMSEAEMILNALQDRLAHHSAITQKTVNTLSKMIEAGIPQPDPTNGQRP